MTPQEFAGKIRAKYPGAYDNMPDEELTQKVIAKYPVYKSQVTIQDQKGDGLTDFSKGVAKSVFTPMANLGSTIANQTAGRVINAAQGKGFTPTVDNNEFVGALNKPSETTAEKAGEIAGDVATFAIPGGVATKATKGAGLLTRVATEAATAGGVTAYQEGEVNRDSLDTAIISAIFPVVGKGASYAKNLFKSPENGGRVINSLIKPLLKDFSYGKNPGQAVAEEGITADTLEELASKISQRRKEIGNQIRETLTPNTTKIDFTDVVAPIDDAIVQAQKNPRTNAELISRLQNVKDDILGATVDGEGKTVYTKNLKDLTALEGTQLKQDIGDITKFTGNASDDALVNKALKQTYGRIKEKINTVVPDVAPLNERYADLTSAEVAAKYRDKIAARQNLIKFDVKTVGIGTALVTAMASGGAAVPSILVGLGAAGLQKAFETPTVKTNFAMWLAKATPAEKQVLFQKAPWAKALILKTYIGSQE